MILPINVKSDDFSTALGRFEQVLGREWVFSNDEDLNLYRDAYSPQWDDEDEPIPSVALAPKNVEEVQAIVRIANEFKIPLFPISTGKNLGYGSCAPQRRGDVVVDL